MTDDEREELDLLRELRSRVGEMQKAALHVFPPSYRSRVAIRVEVPVREWDEMSDAVGDLERFDLDRGRL